MKYISIIILLCAGFFIVGCSSRKKMTKTNSEVNRPIIKLAKSSCFGRCKVFNLKIYEDRTVSYEGVKNVKHVGVFRSTIDDTDYAALVGLFEAIDFDNLEPTYLTGVRDKQKITVGYSEKEVQYQNRAASTELKAITKSIDAIIEKLEWEQG